MASEIRVNKIENRSGLGTVTFADTGVDLAGIVTATTFSGSGASLTSLPAAQVTGTLPAISGANLTNLAAANLTGTIADARFPATLPAVSAANLTSIPAANVTGTLPALTAANLTNIPAANIVGVATAGFERTGGFSGGKILQVVQTKLNTAVSLSGVQSYTDISGFTASITPSSASNKILVMVQMMVSTEGETYFQLLRGSTTIGNSSAGNYDCFAGVFGNTARSSYYDLNSQVFNFLDDAQDTNAHVYKVQWANVTNVSTYLNRTAYSTSGAYYSYSGSSSFTLMEVEV